MSYYKKRCEPQNERYIHIAKDDSDIYQDTETGELLSDYVILERLNEQDKRIKALKQDNENLNNVLEDFMVMLNRLQANPDNEVLQSMAKDMLRMMGKDIMGDSE